MRRNWNVLGMGLVIVALFFGLTATANATVIYVDDSATSGNDNGSDWANAYLDLQDALAAATNGDQLWVAAGTYKPGTSIIHTFTMKAGVGLYGGFAGTETSLEERDWETYETILSGNIGNPALYTDNSGTVVTIPTSVTGVVLDGLTIRDGYQPGGVGACMVGALNSGATIANCLVTENRGKSSMCLLHGVYTFSNSRFIDNYPTDLTYSGGRIVNLSSTASSTSITDCVFDGNGGGALAIAFYAAGSKMEVQNCSFLNNHSFGSGGAMTVSEGILNLNPRARCEINDCYFEANSCGHPTLGLYRNGGALHILSQVDVEINGGSFVGNYSIKGTQGSASGGAVYCPTTVVFNGVSFSGNWSDGDGGAIVATLPDSVPLQLNECFFVGNVSGDKGGAVSVPLSSVKVVGGSFEWNSAPYGGAIYGDGVETEKGLDQPQFIFNSANYGGAVATYEANLKQASFESNTAENDGGAVYFGSDADLTGAGTVDRCLFHCNIATNGEGGAIAMPVLNSTISNSVFAQNDCGAEGPSDIVLFNPTIYVGSNVYSTIVNCSVGNSASVKPWAIGLTSTQNALANYCNIRLRNSILYNENVGVQQVRNEGTGRTTVNYSDSYLGWDGSGSNNLDSADPFWVDQDNCDFHFQVSWSPCIDAGNNSYTVGSLDFYGDPRTDNGNVDIGAVEYQQ